MQYWNNKITQLIKTSHWGGTLASYFFIYCSKLGFQNIIFFPVIEGEQDVWAIDMNSPVLLIWTFLSILVSALGTYSFIQPIWIVTPNQTGSFGLISTCVTVLDVVSPDFGKQRCEFYGGYFNLGSLPSGAWQASCTLFGGGCILLCCGAFLAVCTSCIPNDAVKSVTVMAGYVQFIAGKTKTS